MPSPRGSPPCAPAARGHRSPGREDHGWDARPGDRSNCTASPERCHPDRSGGLPRQVQGSRFRAASPHPAARRRTEDGDFFRGRAPTSSSVARTDLGLEPPVVGCWPEVAPCRARRACRSAPARTCRGAVGRPAEVQARASVGRPTTSDSSRRGSARTAFPRRAAQGRVAVRTHCQAAPGALHRGTAWAAFPPPPASCPV
jgi:hypothetical protein